MSFKVIMNKDTIIHYNLLIVKLLYSNIILEFDKNSTILVHREPKRRSKNSAHGLLLL